MSSLPPRGDEQALVERAKRDPNAFAELYDRYLLQIFRFVYSRVRDQTVAEDVTQEVFMKALKSIGRYQDTGKPFSAWLYQIAVNSVADRYRAARPVEDIAAAMGKTPGAVKLLIHRGVTKVRQTLGPDQPYEAPAL